MKPLSLVDLVASRKGERLIQGLLRFILSADKPFRSAFGKWAGWRKSIREIKEEKKGGIHRHDLIFTLSDNSERKVELKFWAPRTKAQIIDAKAISLFIVPRRYWKPGQCPLRNSKVQYWESLATVIAKNDFAARLMSGLDEYAWTGGRLERSVLLREIEKWWKRKDSDWRGSWFLRGCVECAQVLNQRSKKLQITSSQRLYRNSRIGHWGYYFSLGKKKVPKIWTGFIFRIHKQKVEELEFVLQVPTELEGVLKCDARIPEWFADDWGRTCIIISPKNGMFDVSEWLETCRAIILTYLKHFQH